MPSLYSLPAWKARICRVAGAIFLVMAAATLIEPVVLSIWPAPKFDCVHGCRWKTRPVAMLDEDEQDKVAATPGSERVLAAHVERPIVRLGIFGITLIDSAPFAALLFGVGTALRRIGERGGDPVGQALPWLRRASLAAMAWAIAQPVSNSLMQSLLSLAAPSGPHWYINVDLAKIGTALMLAIPAYAAVWALEAGVRAQRELAEIV